MSPGRQTTAPAFLVITRPLQFHCHRSDLRNGHNLPSFIPVMHPSVLVEQLWGDSRSIRLNLSRPCSLPAPSPMLRSPSHPPLFLPQLLSVGATRTLGIVLEFPPPSPTCSEAAPVPWTSLSRVPSWSLCLVVVILVFPSDPSPHCREIFPKHKTLPCSQPIRAPTGLESGGGRGCCQPQGGDTLPYTHPPSRTDRRGSTDICE